MSNITYITPGPSQLYPGVDVFMQDALAEDVCSISHRSAAYKAIHERADKALRQLVNLPDDYSIMFLGSASEAWERIFKSFVEKKSFHFVNGSFSKKFYQYGIASGVDAQKIQVDAGFGFDVDSVEIDADAELIAFTQNETSTGVQTTVEDIHATRAKYPEALIAVDVVSSLPNPKIDFTKIDTAFFSVQKCFGLPAGLGVWMVNNRCIEKAKAIKASGKSLGAHNEILELQQKAADYQTPSTPNVLGIYLFARVAEAMLAKGIETIREETQQKLQIIESLVESSDVFSHGVKEEKHRSETVVVLNTAISPAEINDKLKAVDLVVGGGYGSFKSTQIRIANFPAISVEKMSLLIEQLKSL